MSSCHPWPFQKPTQAAQSPSCIVLCKHTLPRCVTDIHSRPPAVSWENTELQTLGRFPSPVPVVRATLGFWVLLLWGHMLFPASAVHLQLSASLSIVIPVIRVQLGRLWCCFHGVKCYPSFLLAQAGGCIPCSWHDSSHDYLGSILTDHLSAVRALGHVSWNLHLDLLAPGSHVTLCMSSLSSDPHCPALWRAVHGLEELWSFSIYKSVITNFMSP